MVAKKKVPARKTKGSKDNALSKRTSESEKLPAKIKEKIRIAYIQGATSREELCRKYNIDYKKLDNLIQRNGWNADREEIVGKVREKMEFSLISSTSTALARMNTESTELLDLIQKRIYDPEISNEDLAHLIKSRNTLLRELLRSLGLPDTIRNESGSPDEKSQFNIQIIAGVGELPGSIEKVIGGKTISVGKKEASKDRSSKSQDGDDPQG
ncbi:hypothetical protein [Leptospira weilii]|uniref:Uncharacterized protein n=1 Tax=Leptospira weilii str. UI 13098 TaxID=1088542 RepID=M6Q2B5_9LEPT|nr:hypothetical protein [Leptospira weilii]EMN89429.1 hypothetical protein LEP1GSC108_0395 [Leptospira weilii str. UI 13098]